MFCTHCGTQLPDDSRFCTACGTQTSAVAPPDTMNAAQNTNDFNDQQTSAELIHEQHNILGSVAIPLMMKTGLVKQEAYVLLINSQKIGIIAIGNKNYQQITTESRSNIEGGYFKKAVGMMAAFNAFAQDLSIQPIEEVVAAYPGSSLFSTPDLKKLEFVNQYDRQREQYQDALDVELRIAGQKFRGTLDRGANMRDLKNQLKEMLGKRFKSGIIL